MQDYKKTEMLVNVAKLYYEHGYSQDMVANKLNLSRPYISKLLNEAKEAGIVRIQVIDPTHVESPIERQLREMFHLKKAIIVPHDTKTSPLISAAKEAARYLDGILKDGDTIGVSWGETVYNCSKEIIPHRELERLTVVQLCGGISNMRQNIYATEIVKNISGALNADSYLLPLPAVVDDRTLKRVMLQDHTVNNVCSIGESANIALFTMGTFGLKSALVQAGYLEEEIMEEMAKKGAVGDVCSHVINFDGEIFDGSLDERTIGIPLETIKAMEYRIGVAVGQSKVDCICGALRGGIVNVLVTNEQTAGWVLNKLQRGL